MLLAVIATVFLSCTSTGGGGSTEPYAEQQDAEVGDAAVDIEEESPAEDTPTFRVTEDYWVDTPWFSVSSVVLKVGRTSPRTTIVLPESSIMRDYMRGEADVVISDSFEAQRNQFLLSLGLQLGDTQAFVDEARLRQSFIYE